VTPGAYIALARDLIILLALGLLIWLLMSFGADRVKVADMQAVQKQITHNAQIEAGWRKEQTDANAQRDVDLTHVAAAIALQHAPVIVRNTARACPVSVNTGQASRPPPATGGADARSGGDSQSVDIRPQLNRFELKAETAIADCRAALDSWP
jgi:hypothetical protein